MIAPENIDKDKLKKFFENNIGETYNLHYAQIATVIVLPPIRRSLIEK